MDQLRLTDLLTEESLESISDVHALAKIDSTNAEAQRLIGDGVQGIQLIVADAQTAGRGRRGRSWVSPPGSGMYLSLAYPFLVDAHALQGLSLVTALSAYASVRYFGATDVQLKWPNDILVGNKKLSGILLQLQSAQGQTWVVFGVGINYKLSDQQKLSIGRPVTDMQEILSIKPSLEQLAANVTNRLLQNIAEFQRSGFSTFQKIWNDNDRYIDNDIVIENGNSSQIGRSKGVDEFGALLLQTADGLQKISGGEVIPSLIKASEQT